MQVSALLSALIILSLLSVPGAARAGSKGEKPGKVIAGWVEKIVLLDSNSQPIKAKLDSGAKTSSLHAEDIEEFERNDEKWVRFTFVDKDGSKTEFERPLVRGVKIKDLDGDFDRRSVVEMDFCFDGRVRSAQFTLIDRGDFIYRVLLGRRFLQGVAVIDPEAVYLTKERCIETDEPKKNKKD